MVKYKTIKTSLNIATIINLDTLSVDISFLNYLAHLHLQHSLSNYSKLGQFYTEKCEVRNYFE